MIRFRLPHRCPTAWLILLAVLAGFVAGCGGGPGPLPPPPAAGTVSPVFGNFLRIGDEVQVRLDTTSGGSGASAAPQVLLVAIDDRGEISLPLVGRIVAAGKTTVELTEIIQAHYVPRFYVRCNVTVSIAPRYFYVRGEVRSPGRYSWTDDITLTKAISTAGDFTDYANRHRVEIMRGDKKIVIDFDALRRSPGSDPVVLPGDALWVPRSIF